MEIPRWVWVIVIILTAFWIFNDPAGAADFVTEVVDNVVTFIKNLG